MTEDCFWRIIGQARDGAKGDSERMAERLRSALEQRNPAEIRAFTMRMEEALDRAYSWELWGAAYIMCGGSSDDGFEYWRAWLIAQGQETFESAIRNPESLAHRNLSFVEDGECEFEDFLYVAGEVYEELTGDELDNHGTMRSREPRGERWRESDLPRRFPLLWKKFASEEC